MKVQGMFITHKGWIASTLAIFFSISGVLAYPGCILATACNADAGATIDNGTCVECDAGAAEICDGVAACCIDANTNGTCDYDEICNYPPAHGCTNPQACNYDASATSDVGSCIVCGAGNTCSSTTSCCDDPDNNGICGLQDGGNTGSDSSPSIRRGCTSSSACNYDAGATNDNGGCVFPTCGTWCPGDPTIQPYIDTCGVCDADPTNDGTTCTQTSSEPELPDSVDPEEEINSEEETQIALPEQEFEEQEETFFEPPVFGEPEEGTFEDEIQPPVFVDIEEGEEEENFPELPETIPEVPVEHEEILEEISLKEVVMPSPLGEESPYAYPAVEGAVYVDFTDPIQKSAFEELVKKYGIDSIDQPFTNLDLDYYRIHFDPAVDHGNFIAALQDTFGDNLRFAEPIPLIQVTFPLFDAGTLTKQTMPDYLTQIGYDTLIQQCGYLFTTQQKKVRVAIIDNGYDEHDDIRDNVTYTYDVADKDTDVTIEATSEACAHGNIDAGLVGAISTNDIGIISAGYNPELVLIKATPDGRPCTDITAGIEGLALAAEKADIINVSWGVNFNSQVLEKVVKEILDKGVVIIAAAGNFNTSESFYPAAYPGVISVGAVDENNKKASFSNYGPWVDIAAPGVEMLSTSLRNKYAKVSGTSQAAPLTAGWLAFLMSHGLGTDDLFTYLQPLDVNNLGAGVIDPAAMCADQCTLDYATLDYSGDGIVNDQDLYVVNEWLEDNFTDNGCEENYDPVRCCPEGMVCDIDDDGVFDADDTHYIEQILLGERLYEICGDGIDNNCDGIVDCEEHGAAPLIAQTASTPKQKTLGWLLIGLVLLIGSVSVRTKRAWFFDT